MSLKDPNQIFRDQHDDELSACKVKIVGVQMPEIKLPDIKMPDTFKVDIPKGVETRIERIEVPIPIVTHEVKIVEIEKPVFLERVKEVPIERVVIQNSITTVEKPIVTQELKIIEIEKPVFTEKIKEFPNVVKYALIAQSITMFGIMLVMLFKK